MKTYFYSNQSSFFEPKKKKILTKTKLFIFAVIITIPLLYFYLKQEEYLSIKTIYGTQKITEPVLIELIQSEEMQRLKNIHQYGVISFVFPLEDFNRFEHSLGVLALLRMHNASLEEQVAGLLHDVSHTAFSHVGDLVFASEIQGKKNKSYQDIIHKKYIHSTNLIKILKKYNLAIDKIWDYDDHFHMLERDLPYMCADRIEYNIRGALKKNLISSKDVSKIVKDLYFENGFWYFKTLESAKKLGMVSLHLTQNCWGSVRSSYIYKFFSEALTRAIENNEVSVTDVLYSHDKLVWEKVLKSKDTYIKERINKIKSYSKNYVLSDHNSYTLHFTPKFRGVNPLLKINGKINTLADLDEEFSNSYRMTKNILNRGWYLKLKDDIDARGKN